MLEVFGANFEQQSQVYFHFSFGFDPPLRRVEKFKNSRRNIFRVGKYVYVLGGLKKVV